MSTATTPTLSGEPPPFRPSLIARGIAFFSGSVGFAINPAGLQNNAEGEVVQVTSRVLLEQTRFNTRRISSLDWVSYPIMRFNDAPQVTVAVAELAVRQAGRGHVGRDSPHAPQELDHRVGVHVRPVDVILRR